MMTIKEKNKRKSLKNKQKMNQVIQMIQMKEDKEKVNGYWLI